MSIVGIVLGLQPSPYRYIDTAPSRFDDEEDLSTKADIAKAIYSSALLDGPKTVNQIAALTNKSAESVRAMMLIYEKRGLVSRFSSVRKQGGSVTYWAWSGAPTGVSVVKPMQPESVRMRVEKALRSGINTRVGIETALNISKSCARTHLLKIVEDGMATITPGVGSIPDTFTWVGYAS